jgi:hypothetical protein
MFTKRVSHNLATNLFANIRSIAPASQNINTFVDLQRVEAVSDEHQWSEYVMVMHSKLTRRCDAGAGQVDQFQSAFR